MSLRAEEIHSLLKACIKISTLDLFNVWHSMRPAVTNQLKELKYLRASQQVSMPVDVSGVFYLRQCAAGSHIEHCVNCRNNGIQKAIASFQNDEKMSFREAARIYSVPRSTLTRRLNGMPTRALRTSIMSQITRNNEEVLIKWLISRYAQLASFVG